MNGLYIEGLFDGEDMYETGANRTCLHDLDVFTQYAVENRETISFEGPEKARASFRKKKSSNNRVVEASFQSEEASENLKGVCNDSMVEGSRIRKSKSFSVRRSFRLHLPSFGTPRSNDSPVSWSGTSELSLLEDDPVNERVERRRSFSFFRFKANSA